MMDNFEDEDRNTTAAKTLRVMHVLASLSLRMGGPSVTAVGLARALQDEGVVAPILTTDLLKPAETRNRIGGATLSDLPVGSDELDISIYPIRHPFRLAYSPTLGRAIDRRVQDVDLVHIHGINLYPQFAAWRAARKHRKPYVISPHGALDPWIRSRGRLRKNVNDALWQRRMYNGASALHLTTDEERRLLASRKLRAAHVVVPIAIDVHQFRQRADPLVFRRRWLDGYDGPLILNHGRVSVKKGHDILIGAVAKVNAQLPVHLAFVGVDDEGLGESLRAQAARLHIEDRVTFVPNLVGDELRNAIAAADVWALPSYTENFGVAVVEAMAAGRAVVTSPHVNIAPNAAAAHALVMVPNTVDATSHAIMDLLSSSGRREQLGRNASMYAQRYDWSSVAEQFVEVYERVIRSHHPQ